ncbi:MAG: protein kinase family protein [Tatlockia sp.]|nr:protein kinase family protein [Tatlockia sp.]
MGILTINSNNIEKHLWIWDFLEAERQIGVEQWPKEKIFAYHDKEFKFAALVFVRPRSNSKAESNFKVDYAYEMEGLTKLGAGSFGSVQKISCTLSENRETHLKEISKRNRVVKLEGKSDAESEYALSKKLRHLHLKSPVNGRLVMRNLGEQTLKAYLRNNIKRLSRADRLALTKTLLYVYDEQVIKQNIGHHDLHLSNILININPIEHKKCTANDANFNYELNIIDYGHAKPYSACNPTPDFEKYIAPIINSLWDIPYLPKKIRCTLNNNSNLSDYYNCFCKDELIFSPNSSSQESLDHLMSFLKKLEDINPDLSKELKKIILESIQNSHLNDLKPLKLATIKCRTILNQNNLNDLSFPIVVFGEHHQKQIIFNQIENHCQHLESKGRALLKTSLEQEGKQLCAAVKELREETLNAIYNTQGLSKSNLKACQSICQKLDQKNKKALEIHRDFDYIWAEIAVVLSSLIVLYPLVLTFNYILNKRIGLFSETKASTAVKALDKDFEKLQHLVLN